jgi:hypothetical protein
MLLDALGRENQLAPVTERARISFSRTDHATLARLVQFGQMLLADVPWRSLANGDDQARTIRATTVVSSR